MAEQLVAAMPAIEMVRMVNSGTEATMAALRVARAATGRDRVIKFEGCYHGHADAFLVKAGSGAATFGVPDSPGVTPATAKDTLTASFNDSGSVRELFAAHPGPSSATWAWSRPPGDSFRTCAICAPLTGRCSSSTR